MTRTPFEDTSVPVQRSQDAIRKLLRTHGALGVQFEEDWQHGTLSVRFAWPVSSTDNAIRVRLEVTPLEPSSRFSEAQRERQAWRGISHYLEGTLKAAAFGLVRFEEVFLAYMEDDQGRRIGDVLIPQIEAGQLALPRSTS